MLEQVLFYYQRQGVKKEKGKDCEKSLQNFFKFVLEQRFGFFEQPNSMQELKENKYLSWIVFATCLGVLHLRIAQNYTCHVERKKWNYLVFILATQKTANFET